MIVKATFKATRSIVVPDWFAENYVSLGTLSEDLISILTENDIDYLEEADLKSITFTTEEGQLINSINYPEPVGDREPIEPHPHSLKSGGTE